VVGANVDLVIIRPFTNSSGNAITVEEISMEATTINNAAQVKYVTIAHDLTGGVVVANGETITVTYTFRTTA